MEVLHQYSEKKLEIHQVSSGGTGDAEFLQTGHILLILSHSSMHSAWKQCVHLGMHLRISLGRYSDKHIGQILSLGPERRRLSPSTIFVKDSMVDSSRPTVTMLGCGVTAAGSMLCSELLALLLPCLRSVQHMKTAIPMELMIAGKATVRHIILKIRRPLLVRSESRNHWRQKA